MKTYVRTVAWYALMSLLLAVTLHEAFDLPVWTVFLVSIILIPMLFNISTWLFLKLGGYMDIQRQIDQAKEEILGLGVKEAKDKADLLLRNPVKYENTKDSLQNQTLNQLAPLLQEFFNTYGSVQSVDWDLTLSLREADIPPEMGFMQIGSDGEHTIVAAKPHEDTIYLLGDDANLETNDIPSFPSIYHFILYSDYLNVLSQQ